MPTHIERPTRIQAAGNMPKIIDEYIGRVNLPGKPEDQRVSVAHMRSPGGWVEPGQTPEFDEYTVVLWLGCCGWASHGAGCWRCGPDRRSSPHKGEWIQGTHAGARRRGVHRHLPAGLLAADGPSRRCTIKAIRHKKRRPFTDRLLSLWCVLY